MKKLELIKFIFGIILLGFAIVGGFAFLIESFYDLDILSEGKLFIFDRGYDGGASNAPIFLGLCGIAGAYLLAFVKSE
jgi:hypothetical protein